MTAIRQAARGRSGGSAASILLIHGAGSGPWIFDGWRDHLPNLHVEATDLQARLDPGRAGMAEYAAEVVWVAAQLPQPVALCGWSMGGLVALMAAGAVGPHSLILLEPSPPAEIQGSHPEVDIPVGTFDPEQEYGPFPPGYPARPESAPARAERKRGISVPSIPCPVLVIYGRQFPDERGRQIARLYGASERHFLDLDHWGLVLDPRIPRAVAVFVGNPFGAGRP